MRHGKYKVRKKTNEILNYLRGSNQIIKIYYIYIFNNRHTGVPLPDLDLIIELN